eukprot:c40420_g1_i1 orf=384-764(-)
MNGRADGASCSESANGMDSKVWETFQKSFSQVQTILDQNRILIREINQNHESKIPENLTRNVSLIRELNSNIARVVELYANLSTDFVQSMMEGRSAAKEEVDQMIMDNKNESNSPSSTGQKKPRHA